MIFLQHSLHSTQEVCSFYNVAVYNCTLFSTKDRYRHLGQGSSNTCQLVDIKGVYVQQLQTENSELKVLLEEHQSAMELIMSKYNSQVLEVLLLLVYCVLCYIVQLIMTSVKLCVM